jgi:two-component system, OmpR family, phosphate regulon response regulator PhoB
LLRQVWGSQEAWQTATTVTEHVRRLRHKIESDPDRPRWIQTVRGVGYRFESDAPTDHQ